MKTIHTVAAVVVNEKYETLLVRKRGTDVFIQPGGKRTEGESDFSALSRELEEELGAKVIPQSVIRLGTFQDVAINEPGCLVQADAYLVEIKGTLRPRAEIEELSWVSVGGPFDLRVAPLSSDHILPAVVKYLASKNYRRTDKRVEAVGAL
jgi:8-oxo-dGTP pyrophosphatase MutT (NUDIX family)